MDGWMDGWIGDGCLLLLPLLLFLCFVTLANFSSALFFGDL